MGLVQTKNTKIEGIDHPNEFEILITDATAPYAFYLLKVLRNFELQKKSPIKVGDILPLEFNEDTWQYIALESLNLDDNVLHFTLMPDPADENYPEGTTRCARCGYLVNPSEHFESKLTGREICQICYEDEQEMDDIELTPGMSLEEMLAHDHEHHHHHH